MSGTSGKQFDSQIFAGKESSGLDTSIVDINNNSIELGSGYDFCNERELSVDRGALKGVDLPLHSTSLSYYMYQEENFKGQALNLEEKLVGTDWRLAFKSSDSVDTNQYSYKAVVFINEQAKKVLIASAGTIPTDIRDLIDCHRVQQGKVPYKIDAIKAMITKTIELVGGEEAAADFEFSTSGHSLGAVNAQLAAACITGKGLKLGTCNTYENPGALKAITTAFKDGLLTTTAENFKDTIEIVGKHSVCENARPNPINMCNPQLGQVNLRLYGNQDIEVSTSWSFTKHLYDIVGAIIKPCAQYLGISASIQKLDCLRDHGIQYFEQLNPCIIPTDNWAQVGNQLVIPDSPDWDQIISTGNDAIVLSSQTLADHPTYEVIGVKPFAFQDFLKAPTQVPGVLVQNDEHLGWFSTCAQEYNEQSPLIGMLPLLVL